MRRCLGHDIVIRSSLQSSSVGIEGEQTGELTTALSRRQAEDGIDIRKIFWDIDCS
ncbi:hypothetical protein [Thalassoglobus sp.]|uniref:hypothetical protein n=1 Tax=Thalassoglobus sp. TaxID=2795869 RepID=UPI003AA8FEE4